MFKRIYIEITNACNLNCSFCKGSNREKKFMDSASFEKILKKIKGYTEHIYLHVLGEPLMHPELDAILDLSYRHGMKVNITTNGRLLEKKLDIINQSKSIRQLNISLHSFNNLDEIHLLLNTIDNIKNDCYISFRLWNLGVSNNNLEVVNAIKKHYQKTIMEDDKGYKLKDKVYLNFSNQFRWPNINDEERSKTGTCYGLRNQLGILVDGTIIPCCLDSDGIINLGNIFKDDLETILNSHKCKLIKEGFLNRKLVEPLCRKCCYIKRFDKDGK